MQVLCKSIYAPIKCGQGLQHKRRGGGGTWGGEEASAARDGNGFAGRGAGGGVRVEAAT